jgi:excisionase family DNA binding protein
MKPKTKIVPGRAFLRVDELAERWACSTRTIYNYIESGNLPAYKIGGCLRINASDIFSYERNSKIRLNEWMILWCIIMAS